MDKNLKDPIIRIQNVSFQRDDKVILDDVSMDIQRGSIVAIMGPSGVGKTTILRLISGQLQPSCGSIEVNGKEVSAMTRRQLYECRKDIGVLLQNGALFTDLTVFENVATPLREHTDLSEDAIRERVSTYAIGFRLPGGSWTKTLSFPSRHSTRSGHAAFG